jgi:hypothetical protein
MKNKIIIDNALTPNEYESLYNHMMSVNFEWSFNPGIVQGGDEQDYQFVHGIHTGYHMTSPNNYRYIFPLNEILAPQAIVRIKANLTTRGETTKTHGMHTDMAVPGSLTAIYYVNDNNGSTKFEDGDSIDSVANRLVIFPSNLRHSGTRCTDQQRRIVINFNYMPWRDDTRWHQLMSQKDIDYRNDWEKDMQMPYNEDGVPCK